MMARSSDVLFSQSNIEPLFPLDTQALSEIEPEEISWLWRGRIARGKVTMIVGDPGDGKSYLTLAIAGAVSRGIALPDSDPAPPAHCLLWNGEDGVADTIRKRAERVGSNLERLVIIHGAKDGEGARIPFGLKHLPDLYAEIERRGNVELVVIDPIGALLGGIDAHKDAEVRSTLQPLADLARETGAAVAVVAHLNKATAQRALYRVGGSIGFVGLARSVLLVARDHETGRRAVAQVKSNLAQQVPPIEFRIDDDGLWWSGIAEDLTSDRLLADPSDVSARDEAKRSILEALAEGQLSAKDLERVTRDSGVSRRTYERARSELKRDGKIKSGRHGYQGGVCWQLASQHTPSYAPYVQKVAKNGKVGEQCDSYSANAIHTPPLELLTSPEKLIQRQFCGVSRARASELSLHGKLCRICKRVDVGYDCGDGTFVCAECSVEGTDGD